MSRIHSVGNATRAAVIAPTAGRVLYAAIRAPDLPTDQVTKLWQATTLLREYRVDGHNLALSVNGIGGTEAHVLFALFALSIGLRPGEFGRLSHQRTDRSAHRRPGRARLEPLAAAI